MDRRDWFFGQKVTEGELQGSQDAVEDATRRLQFDMSFEGIAQGLVATEAGAPNLTVEVSAGVAYNSLGERCQHPTAVIVDVSKDYLGVSTTITQGAGFEAILGVSIGFARLEDDDRIDDNDNPLFFESNEYFVYRVTKGAETNTPPAVSPPLEAGFVRVCDVRLVHGASAITNAYITPPGGTYTAIPEARQDMFVASAGSLEVRANNAEEAVQQLLTLLNNHPASEIAVDASSDWHDGDTNPADDLQARLDKVIDDLADDTGAGGSDKLGAGALTPWIGGRARPAGSIFDQLEAVGVDLGAAAAGDDGMERVGGEQRTSALAGGLVIPVGTAATQAQYLIDQLPQLGVTTTQLWAGPQEYDAKLFVDGDIDVRSDAVVTGSGSLTVNTGAALTLQTGSPATISRILTLTGADSGIQYRLGTIGDADANLDVGTDAYRVAANPTAPRTFTLLDSTGNTPVDGQVIRVFRTFTGVAIPAMTFQRESGPTTLAQFPVGSPSFVEFTYDSSGNGWYVSAFGGSTTVTSHT